MYAPLTPEMVLRRDCSPDYTDADLGDPVLEVILQPGVRRCTLTCLCYAARASHRVAGHQELTLKLNLTS